MASYEIIFTGDSELNNQFVENLYVRIPNSVEFCRIQVFIENWIVVFDDKKLFDSADKAEQLIAYLDKFSDLNKEEMFVQEV